MKVAFCTLGCKVNQYDTDAMREMFINAGHTVVDFDDIADVYVINTFRARERMALCNTSRSYCSHTLW